MNKLLSMVLLLLAGVFSCGPMQEHDAGQMAGQNVITHRTGHGADPPPCTNCDKAQPDLERTEIPPTTGPLELQSFANYGFIRMNDALEPYFYLYPLEQFPDTLFKVGETVYFNPQEHSVIDVDTVFAPDGSIVRYYYPTGIKLEIGTELETTFNSEKTSGKIANRNQVRRGANLKRIHGLHNASYVSDIGRTMGLLSQEYAHLGNLEILKDTTLYIHSEDMDLFIGSQRQPYTMKIAVDIQFNHGRHTFATHDHALDSLVGGIGWE